MKNVNRLVLTTVVLSLFLLLPSLQFAEDDSECDGGIALQAPVVALNNSGVTGNARCASLLVEYAYTSQPRV